MKTPQHIYSIGHSTHTIEYFIELLQAYGINCIIDVRTVPASKYNPQYNQVALKAQLFKNNIQYLHFAREFGARQDSYELLDEYEQLSFEKVRNSLNFQSGVKRVLDGINKGFCISLMCSEAEPLDCHRFSLVSVGLAEKGIDIQHILKDKTTIPQKDLETLLLKKYANKIHTTNLFEEIDAKSQLKEAYKLINKAIGYKPNLKQDEEEEEYYD